MSEFNRMQFDAIEIARLREKVEALSAALESARQEGFREGVDAAAKWLRRRDGMAEYAHAMLCDLLPEDCGACKALGHLGPCDRHSTIHPTGHSLSPPGAMGEGRSTVPLGDYQEGYGQAMEDMEREVRATAKPFVADFVSELIARLRSGGGK